MEKEDALEAKTMEPNESDAPKKCEGKKPLFDREDIVWNQGDYNEDASNSSELTLIVYNSPNRKSRSPSKSRVRRSSYTKSRSSTPEHRKLSGDRSLPQHSSKYERRRSSSREYSSRYQSYERDRRKSRSKEYSPSLKTRHYEPKRSERHRSRDHSPPLRAGEYRPRKRSRSRDYSPPLRAGEYKPRKRSRSRDYSPPLRAEEYKPRKRSRSRDYSPPLRAGEYKPRKRSRSRDNSPPLRAGEYKPRKRSRSRDYSPPLRAGEYKPRKRSRSRDYSPPLRAGEYHPKKVIRSRSPHCDKYDSSRRSRSPKPSTSRSGCCKHMSRSHSPPNEHTKHVVPPQYPYYPETEFWYPPGFPRGNPPPVLHPFGAFPRGIAPPVLYPYPRFPPEGYRPPFRRRLPIYNSEAIVRKKTAETITSTSAESSTSVKNSEVGMTEASKKAGKTISTTSFLENQNQIVEDCMKNSKDAADLVDAKSIISTSVSVPPVALPTQQATSRSNIPLNMDSIANIVGNAQNMVQEQNTINKQLPAKTDFLQNPSKQEFLEDFPPIQGRVNIDPFTLGIDSSSTIPKARIIQNILLNRIGKNNQPSISSRLSNLGMVRTAETTTPPPLENLTEPLTPGPKSSSTENRNFILRNFLKDLIKYLKIWEIVKKRKEGNESMLKEIEDIITVYKGSILNLENLNQQQPPWSNGGPNGPIMNRPPMMGNQGPVPRPNFMQNMNVGNPYEGGGNNFPQNNYPSQQNNNFQSGNGPPFDQRVRFNNPPFQGNQFNN